LTIPSAFQPTESPSNVSYRIIYNGEVYTNISALLDFCMILMIGYDSPLKHKQLV